MTAEDAGRDETTAATRNAIKLGTSLLGTWGVAIVVRLLLPRYLGPERFGTLSFAEAFSTTFFVALGLGAEIYIRKQVAVRPEHASDFIGGTILLRVALSGVIVAVMAVVMNLTGQPAAVRYVVYLFAVALFFVHVNNTLAALLQAEGSVGGMSVLAVVTKVIWALGVLVGVVTGAGLWAFALAYLVSEVVETIVLFRLTKRHLNLVFRLDFRATYLMTLFSMPYYLNEFATTAYGKLDIALLAFLATRAEVGWYAAASAIAGLTLLATPLISWVLMPTFARAAARSRDELFLRIRRSTDLILSVAIPASLFTLLGADVLIQVIFGQAFAPAALALRILSGTFVVTYIAMVYAITLLMLERPWVLTGISLCALVVNVALNVMLVPWALSYFGAGGGGAGSGLAMLGTEVFAASAMALVVGPRAFDRRTFGVVVKSLGACALAVAVDRMALGLGWLRFGLSAIAYLVVVLWSGALNARQIWLVLRAAFPARAAPAQT
jgi:O-antigen/teichoic acid export membrane protein